MEESSLMTFVSEVDKAKTILMHDEGAIDQRSNERLDDISTHLFANALPNVVWTASPDGKIDFFNEAWSRATGSSREGASSSIWLAALQDQDRAIVLEAWRSGIHSAKAFRLEFRLWSVPHQEYRWQAAQIQPIRGATGTILKWVASCQDVHDQRSSETLLQMNEARLKALVESSPVGLIILKANGEPVYYNQKCAELRGLDVELSEWSRFTHLFGRENNRFHSVAGRCYGIKDGRRRPSESE